MGASGWSYFIKYERDPTRALRALQERVFKRKEYGQSEMMRALLDQATSQQSDADLAREARLYAVAKRFEKVMRGNVPPDQINTSDLVVTPELIAEFRAHRDREMRKWTSKKTDTFPTIAALREHFGESGTHSILDITGISQTPSLLCASPLPESQMIRVFSTNRPSRAVIEKSALPLQSIVVRWQAWYVPIWSGGRKTHYYFEGASGD